MLKLSIFVLFLSTLISFQLINAQESPSVQINGGLIAPVNSSTGFSGSIQINYPLSQFTDLYLFSGYSHYDKYYVNFPQNSSLYQKSNLKSHSGIDHLLIPVLIGISSNVHSNDLFSSFLNFEIGYSFLKFTSYSDWITITNDDGVILSYYPDENTRKDKRQNLFAIGIGGGIFREVTQGIKIILSLKLNSHINSEYPGFFSAKGTYATSTIGLNLAI